MLLGLFILSFFVSVGTMHKFFPKQKIIYQTINTHPKTAYFTVREDRGFTNKTIKLLSEELSNTKNGGYTTPPSNFTNCIETFMKNPEKHPNHPTNVVSTILSHIDNK